MDVDDRLASINKSRQLTAGMGQTTDKHLANNRIINQRMRQNAGGGFIQTCRSDADTAVSWFSRILHRSATTGRLVLNIAVTGAAKNIYDRCELGKVNKQL